MFIAEKDGWTLTDADYSQIELRVLAHIADDSAMKQAFLDNEDMRTQTAATVFKTPVDEVTPLMRSRAKAVQFRNCVRHRCIFAHGPRTSAQAAPRHNSI